MELIQEDFEPKELSIAVGEAFPGQRLVNLSSFESTKIQLIMEFDSVPLEAITVTWLPVA